MESNVLKFLEWMLFSVFKKGTNLVIFSNFDTMIGRTAHIRYLSDRQFIKVFCIVFEKFFK